jgi:hypothetical protein
MQRAHIQRHFLSGGIGLRHIVDYYMLMKISSEEDRRFVASQLSRFGLRKTAGAVMWMMSELFSMESDRMICPKDERRGRCMLDEAFKSGNFGWYHENRRKGYWQTVISGILIPIRLMGFSFQECLWINVKFVIYIIRTIPKRIKYRSLSLRYVHEE